jgi:ATP-binding cassette subfamily B protein
MLLRFLKKYGWLYLPGFFFLILNARVMNLAPAALGDAVDMLAAGCTREEILRQAGRIVLIAVGVFVTFFAFRMCIIMNARRMEVFFREELFRKLQFLPQSYFARQRSGEMMAYAVNDVNAARQVFGPALAMGARDIVSGAIAIWAMARECSPGMTALALLPLPFALAAIFLLGNQVYKRSRLSQDLFQKISGFVNESIMGMRVIKSYAREDAWQRSFGAMSADMRDANVRLGDVTAWLNAVSSIAFGFSYAAALLLGGRMVLRGRLALGTLVAFLGYLLVVQQPVNVAGRIMGMVQRGLASYRRLRAVDREISIPEKERISRGKPAGGALEAKRLSFTYPGAERPALSDVSFRLPEGGILGVAGGTGSGKSTLGALLMKLYETEPGMLFLGGEDLTEIPAVDIRSAAGYVPQDGFLFSASIRENILFYAPGKTEEDMLTASELACIRREIEAFPQGFDTQVGERGTHLSGGQKQRIALARALLRDPSLLILDDTLSAVDNLTEKAISAKLRDALRGKTVVLISHRMSALRDADEILFLDAGRVAERGTHRELMDRRGLYYEAWMRQAREGGRPE